MVEWIDTYCITKKDINEDTCIYLPIAADSASSRAQQAHAMITGAIIHGY
jgi:hypothetical protein